eukprot:COSAG02_NODE_835_length_16654_cov_52.747569_7_plen_51_part_00
MSIKHHKFVATSEGATPLDGGALARLYFLCATNTFTAKLIRATFSNSISV